MKIVNILALFQPLALSLTSVVNVPAKPTKAKPYGIFRYIRVRIFGLKSYLLIMMVCEKDAMYNLTDAG